VKEITSNYRPIERQAAIYFRNQFRDARAAVLRDAEAVDEIIHVLERLGMFRSGKLKNLGDYQGDLKAIAGRSPLAKKVPADCHIQFSALYNSVREGRNVAMHQGAYARHLANHAVRLAIILEDALMNGNDKLKDRMVQNPVCAELWQPLSFIRQTMLESSFSYLPVRSDESATDWSFVCDIELARYLREAENDDMLEERLVESLAKAQKKTLRLSECKRLYNPEDPIGGILPKLDHLPVLVVRKEYPKDLVGIITAHDLL